MNSPSAPQPAWKSYLAAVSFMAPALFFWAVVSVFVFPKVQQMWRDANIPTSDASWWLMGWLQFGVHNSKLIIGLILVALIAFEFSWQGWARLRRAALALAVFLLNTYLVFQITLVAFAMAVAGPALMNAQK